MNTETPAGPRCAVHIENPAAGACTRCGNFVCYLDTEGEKFTTCAACRARTQEGIFPLTRASYSFDALWAYSWNLFKQSWLMLTVGFLVLSILAVAASTIALVGAMLMLTGKSFLSSGTRGFIEASQRMRGSLWSIPVSMATSTFSYVVYIGAFAGFARYVQDLQSGQRPDFGRFFSGFARPARLLAVSAIFGSTQFVFARGLNLVTARYVSQVRAVADPIVALKFAGFTYGAYFVMYLLTMPWLWFIYPELALTDAGPIAALGNCFKIARGFFFSMLLLTVVIFAVCLAGGFACCIGVLPAMAFTTVIAANLHRALRTGADNLVGVVIT